jgi:hypothetical protein
MSQNSAWGRKRFILTVPQKSAEGKEGHAVGKASEALQCRKAEKQDRPSRERWNGERRPEGIPARGIKEQVSRVAYLLTGQRQKPGPNTGTGLCDGK